MSDTPRTDAEVYPGMQDEQGEPWEPVDASFARRLERELSDLDAARRRAYMNGYERGCRAREQFLWIVREAGGQCWGPFESNAEAAAWADANKIDTCDFEDVMPPNPPQREVGGSDGK